jgi:hypothetical protein
LIYCFLEAVRSHYRISKNNYLNFYAKVIQKVLSDCIYNEGTRKHAKQPVAQQPATTQAAITSAIPTTAAGTLTTTTSASASH